LNKFIKSLTPILIVLFFFTLISCSVSSNVKSIINTAKANATAETLSSASLESIIEGGDYPSPKGWVNDFAGILKNEDIDKMNELLTDLEKKTTAEVAVATVVSLDGKSIEMYANDLFSAWGIGKKDVNNGALFLVALNERQCRIEVGYGLESVLTDVIARDIINEIAIPRFKNNEYSLGSYEAVKKISEYILSKSQK
jgi:uncharacterized protein